MLGATQATLLGAPLWTPAMITTSVWYDAADSGTITLSGSNVTQWNDKSGNARNATVPSGFTGPTVSGSKLVFASQRLQVPTAAYPGAGHEIITVLDATTTGNNATGIVYINSSPADDPEIRIGVGDAIRIYYNAGYAYNVDAAGTLTTGIFSVSIDSGGVCDVYKNGTRLGGTTRSGALSSIGNFNLGYGVATNGYRDGDIQEIVIQAINTTNRQLTEGYLAWKWGLQGNLPADHPYKNAAPTI